MLAALFIATTGFFPGLQDPDEVLNVMMSFIGIGPILFLISFVSGFADDIEKALEYEGNFRV
jgi:hypothetical protein